jgi:serine/threonine protein kinase
MNASEETIFNVALDKHDSQERSAYLDQACGGDTALRNRIEQLISAYGEGAFLEAPAAGVTATLHQESGEQLGTLIGPYKLLQQIGEGGMGVVYMAEQTEPVKRRVALKIIKPGMDSRQVIGRFEAERQALALMDHPNIAKVLDAGTTASGRPFFVMELIKGIPITKYCDERHLSLRERLELLIPVCQAIQHAHQKGIIHRDIKPTNVLIAQFDGRPVPKVIDFGVAKATAQTLTERTMFTELGQIVGTVEYMSPEQAELNQLDIDTRSDIYSLGVLLYELLTGSTPFNKQTLRDAAFHEMLRIIREDEPLKPSTRLSTIDTLPFVAANRSVEPARLSNTVKGELDWIVMKALDKDRARRYATADSFAGDLKRYLNDEPVHAHPPSAAYRFRKFAHRYRAALTTTALLITLLITGAAVSTWQAIRATRAEARARHNEARALMEQQKAKAAAVAETEQRKRAEEQTRLALGQRQLLENNHRVNTMVTDQILTVLNDIPVPAAKRQALLVTVLSRLSELDPADRVKAFQNAGNQFVKMNQYPAAISAFNEGLSLDPKNPGILVSRGDVYFRQKEYQKAATDYSAAIENQRPNDPASVLAFVHRAFARCRLEQFEPALADFRAAFDAAPEPTLKMIGEGFRDTYVLPAPHAPFDQRLHAGIDALFDRYVADQQQSEAARLFCADYLGMMKQYDSARKHHEAIVASGATSFMPHYSLAILALERGDQVAHRQVCAAMVARSAIAPDDEYTSFTAWCCGLGPGALDDYTEIIETARRSLAKRPTSGQRLQILGLLLLRAGQYEEARQWLAKAIAAQDDRQGSQLYSRYYLALANHRLGRVEDAQKNLRAALSMGQAYFSWRFQVQHQLIRREAKQLIEPMGTSANAPAEDG